MRLDRFVASNSEHSRSEVKRLIHLGRIEVNNIPASAASQHVHEHDLVNIDGRVVSGIGKLYIMLNKPAGYVCATEDAVHPTVLELLQDRQCFVGNDTQYEQIQVCVVKKQLQIVGRLDLDTTGLLLLTNDGQWNHQITSPNSLCAKSYRATLAEPINSDTLHTFEKGVFLKYEDDFTQPSTLTILEENVASVSIYEGKYHQVKRMFAACGNRVVSLHREQIGTLELDPSLAAGKFRLLSANETV